MQQEEDVQRLLAQDIPWEDNMPYVSEKQRKWMHVNEPEIAEKWDEEERSMKYRKRLKRKSRD